MFTASLACLALAMLMPEVSAVTSGPHIVSSKAVPPGVCDTVASEAGYYSIDDKKKYFYWFFESRDDASKDPIFIWLTGGPGCSSQVALFHENGPCRINADHKSTTPFEHSWNRNASVIYVDQPAGVGFSTGPLTDRNERDVQEHMYVFLLEFFESNPHLQGNDFYVVGESYGGHYVPNVAQTIFEGNKKNSLKINLKGIAIGNGLTDPINQYNKYCDFGLNNDYRPVTTSVNAFLVNHMIWPLCKSTIDSCGQTKYEDEGSCTRAMGVCNMIVGKCASILMEKGWNIYNVNEKCEVPPLCYDFKDVEDFVSSESTRKLLGVGDIQWQSCSMDVHQHFTGDFMRGFAPVVKELLEGDVRVLIYAGDADYICNWMGNDEWTRQLEWKHGSEFKSQPLKPWFNGKGELRQFDNLSFLKVIGAGHMVPLDQPVSAINMINQFFNNQLKADE